MTASIRREVLLPHSQNEVWQALSTRAGLAAWMYPNDFEPEIGHRFAFQVPPDPTKGFDGLIVRCEVLECDAPNSLVFSWSAGGVVENTRVSFRLEPVAEGTMLILEHSGFDLAHPFGKQALGGAKYGWTKMLEKLQAAVVSHVQENA